MPASALRRTVLRSLTVLPVAGSALAAVADDGFAQLERELDGELGVAAIDHGSGRVAGYRQDQRFSMCSTFKAVLAAAVLARADGVPGLLGKRVLLAKDDFVDYSPVTGKHAGGAMTVAELCAAALQYSDNTAANALLRELGGPAALTGFARSMGDTTFRLDRWETALNTALPGDERDTTTPLAMARTLDKLLLGDALAAERQAQLREWMLGNTTGGERIRAAVPPGWQVADKTGTGSFGSASDIGVIYRPAGSPVVLAIYTRGHSRAAKARSDIIARAARLALARLGA